MIFVELAKKKDIRHLCVSIAEDVPQSRTAHWLQWKQPQQHRTETGSDAHETEFFDLQFAFVRAATLSEESMK